MGGREVWRGEARRGEGCRQSHIGLCAVQSLEKCHGWRAGQFTTVVRKRRGSLEQQALGQMALRSLGGDMSSKESQQPNHGLPLPLGNVVEVGGWLQAVGGVCRQKAALMGVKASDRRGSGHRKWTHVWEFCYVLGTELV